VRCPASVPFTIPAPSCPRRLAALVLKPLLVATLAMLAAAPCLANVAAFRVTNPTASSWELQDQTRRIAGMELRFGPTDPVQGGRAHEGGPWVLEPGATLVFVATGTGARGGVELGLRPAPGNPIVPDAPASLFMPLIPGTLENAFAASGEVREINRWMITEKGYFAFDWEQGWWGLPSEHPAPHGAKRLRQDQDREPKGPGIPGDRLRSGKSRRVGEAPRIQGSAPASKAPIALTLENRSRAPWVLVVGEGGPRSGATLKPILGMGTGGQRAAVPVPPVPDPLASLPDAAPLLDPLSPMTGDSASTSSSPVPWRTPTLRIPDQGLELRPSRSPGQLPSPPPAQLPPFSASTMALPDAALPQDRLTP